MFTIHWHRKSYVVSHEYHPNFFVKRPSTEAATSQGHECLLGTKAGSTLFALGCSTHCPRSCRHGSIDEQRGVHSLRGVPLMESMVRDERMESEGNMYCQCTARATCRQRGQRRKLICYTSLLVYAATVTVTPPLFLAHPHFLLAHPSIQMTQSTV